MFGLGKKKEIKKIDINQAYELYQNNPDDNLIICIDEIKDYDDRHVEGAECLPCRLLKDFKNYYPEKDLKYYLYALNPALAERGAKIVAKLGYDVYDAGSLVDFHGIEEGLQVTRKHRRRKK